MADTPILTPEQLDFLRDFQGELQLNVSGPRYLIRLKELIDSHEALRADLAASEQARQQAEQERDSRLTPELAAHTLLYVKGECERQHARAEAAEAARAAAYAEGQRAAIAELEAIALWIRRNVSYEDAVDSCARVLENRARDLAMIHTPAPQEPAPPREEPIS